MKKSTKFSIAVTFVVIALLVLMVGNFGDTMQYYLTVDEMHGRLNELGEQEFRLSGRVVEGSIEEDSSSGRPVYRFQVAANQQVVDVDYTGLAPDTFNDKSSVVVTGWYSRKDSKFYANHLLAKCASKYEEKLDGEYLEGSTATNK